MYEFVGFIGVFCYVLSYAMLQYRRDFAKSFTYSILNLFGAGFLLVSLADNWNFPSFVIQVIWLVLSLYGLGRCYQYRKAGSVLEYKKRPKKH